MDHETLVSIFWSQAEALRDKTAVRVKSDGAYRDLSWARLSESVLRTGAGLIACGLDGGDRVGLLSENRLEWIEADFAIMSAGAITVALYAPLTAAQVLEQFTDCSPTVVFVSTSEQRDKLLSVRKHLPSIRQIVIFEPTAATDDVISLEGVKAKGVAILKSDPECLERRMLAVTPDDLAALSYTSGTTGESKGVMLTHANLVSNVRAMEKHLPPEGETVVLTFLPLNHIYARTCDLYFCLCSGRILALAESVDTILQNLQEIRPHHLSGVPRFHQKFMELALPPFEAGDKDALRKVLGGNIRWVSAGGAALSPDVARFYFAAGVPIYQGYGLTETSPVISFSKEGRNRIGAAGVLLDGVEVKIAADGEILSRGPHIMKGYWNKPEATRAVLRPDGWFHTGDVGFLDDEGFLHITDRKKDIIVTSYGKNVAPQQIEGLLCCDPFIDQAVVCGDSRPCLVALIVPSRQTLTEWAAGNGLEGKSWDELLSDAKAHTLYEQIIGNRLKDLSSHEQIRRFALLPEPFSVDKGEMTVTAKLRRRAISEKYAELIEELYTV